MAFGLMPGDATDRVVAALAAQQAAVAIIAMLRILDQPKHGPARHDAQQRTQRAQCAAPEPRDAEIQCNEEDKNQAQPDPLTKIGLLETQKQRSQDEVQRAANCLHGANRLCSSTPKAARSP